MELGLRDIEGFGQVGDVLGRGFGLAVEEGGDGDFVAAEGLGEGFEGEVFGLFGGEEEGGLGGKAGKDVLLFVFVGLVLCVCASFRRWCGGGSVR